MIDHRRAMPQNGALSVDHPHDADSAIERAAPWISSFFVHAGLGLLATFILYAAFSPSKAPEKFAQPMNIADTLDPASQSPAGEKQLSSAQGAKAMQNMFKDSMNAADPFGQMDTLKQSHAAQGELARTDVPMIAAGTGGSLGRGDAIGLGDIPGGRARYGSFMQGGPKGAFLRGTRAMRTVYLLDHSGSMMDTFDYLKVEVKAATKQLIPAQRFSVIMFSEDVDVLGPNHLQRATDAVKRDIARQIDAVRAAGQNDDLLLPFQKGFEKAFAMNPQVIIFLTDGRFDPRLVEVVRKLNKTAEAQGRKVQIQTIAFIQIEPDAAASLKQIASENGGAYKFVSEKDLGK